MSDVNTDPNIFIRQESLETQEAAPFWSCGLCSFNCPKLAQNNSERVLYQYQGCAATQIGLGCGAVHRDDDDGDNNFKDDDNNGKLTQTAQFIAKARPKITCLACLAVSDYLSGTAHCTEALQEASTQEWKIHDLVRAILLHLKASKHRLQCHNKPEEQFQPNKQVRFVRVKAARSHFHTWFVPMCVGGGPRSGGPPGLERGFSWGGRNPGSGVSKVWPWDFPGQGWGRPGCG